jgi:hypothetical protein
MHEGKKLIEILDEKFSKGIEIVTVKPNENLGNENLNKVR